MATAAKHGQTQGHQEASMVTHNNEDHAAQSVTINHSLPVMLQKRREDI